jgi:hypothetical protein
MKTKGKDLITETARVAGAQLTAFSAVETNAKKILEAAIGSDKDGVAWEIHLTGKSAKGIVKTANGLLRIES